MAYDPTKKFDEMTASDFASAMTAALSSYGVARSGEFSSSGGSYEPRDTTDYSGVNTEIDGIEAGERRMGDTSNQIHNRLVNLENALKLAGTGVNMYNGALASAAAEFKPFLTQLNKLQEDYGGITLDPDEAVGAAKAVQDRLQGMQEMFYTESGDQMAASLGFQENVLSKYFKNDKEAFEASENVIRRLVEQHSQFINQMDEQTLYTLPMYTKALGVNTRDLAEVLEIQINRTGKANTDILEEIAVFSDGLAKSTGIPMKSISANAVQIVKDTQRWGDTTAEEATRIAAQLGQLGQTYDSFTSLTDKFQEFGSAAETSGLISQITGGAVNLDAQKLMYLASEEKEKFLPELRRSLLSGGFDLEAYMRLSEAEQRQMASGLTLNRNNMMQLLDTTRSFDDIDLQAEQENIKATGDSQKALTDNMELAAKSTDNLTKTMEHHRAKALLANKDALLQVAEGYSNVNSKMRSLDFTDANKASELYNKTLMLQRKGLDTIEGGIPDQASVKDVGNYLTQETQKIAAKQSTVTTSTTAGNDQASLQNKFFGTEANPSPKSPPRAIEPTSKTPSDMFGSDGGINISDTSVTQLGTEINTANSGFFDKLESNNQGNLEVLSSENTANVEEINANTNDKTSEVNTSVSEMNKALTEKIDALTTSIDNLVNAGEKEIVLNIDGNKVGSAVLSNKYTVGGVYPVQIVTAKT